MQRLKKFVYIRPESVTEACAVLQEAGSTARVLAGGTDVLVAMKEKGLSLASLVDIKGLTELMGIKEVNGGLKIGALTTLHEVEISPLVMRKFPAVAVAAGSIGSLQVRNRGTLGGNLCNAAPSADSAPVLIAYGALANICGSQGERQIPLQEFFQGPGKTSLASGELLASIVLPAYAPRTGGAYLKYGPREAMDIAIVGVGVTLGLDETGTCREAKIVLGSVAPTPMRAIEAEKTLIGQKIDVDIIAKAAAIAGSEAKPISDQRSSAEYRKELVIVLTRRAIEASLVSIV